MLSSLRARLRTTRAWTRPVSTSLPRRNDAAADMASLSNVLDKQGDATPPIHQSKPSSTNRPQHEYKPINPNTFIRPYDLSLEGRSWPNRLVKRRANVAPATRDARKQDVFYQLGVDPLKFALHPGILSHFVSELSMIQPRRQTGLTMKSQRRIAKAIRRAKMMGVIPLHSRLQDYGDFVSI
ncbi:hypothetical protein B0H15DRAFT_830208 [Mycena belliarum]|uniref:Small ribosomal subunit protein bS18m n=1 Tax=Mycena belliarum TaxID=1033014 RepID=A0AAD6U9W2_9AGAR|nr:hypothetical protein B0H15DRAFT_830208 [Mycena belliae]